MNNYPCDVELYIKKNQCNSFKNIDIDCDLEIEQKANVKSASNCLERLWDGIQKLYVFSDRNKDTYNTQHLFYLFLVQ